MHTIRHVIRAGPRTPYAGAAGTKNPPSAPPAIPPIVIDPFADPMSRYIPHPSIDPRPILPGPPVVPPPAPALRII
jgi:hypothetical protein